MDQRLSLRHHAAFISYSELTGNPVPASFLISRMRLYGREAMVMRLAVLAANMANEGLLNPFIFAVTRRALTSERPGSVLAHFVATRPADRPILHERVLYFLQALALVEGNDSTTTPTDADLAEIVIVANDYFGDWEVEAPTLTRLERLLAVIARDSRYNRGGDLMVDFVRNWTIFETPIPNGPLAEAGKREALEATAFGMPLARYLEQVAGPIALTAALAGRLENGSIKAPITDPVEWFKGTTGDEAARVFTERLVIDADEARAEIERAPNGLPKTPLCLFRRPLIRFAPNRLVTVSPWLLREQLRLGLWGHLRSASVKLFGNPGAEIWTRAFGDMFEAWARRRATESLTRLPNIRAIVAERAGTGELEDVVITSGKRVALISVKARLMPERPVKRSTDPSEVVDWYRSVLFTLPEGKRRAGALHLLDANIRRVRNGESVGVPADARVYPILVTFEELGDGPVLYKWVREQCATLHIMQDVDAAPLCFLSADDYEDLLGYAAAGHDIFELLDARGAKDEGLARLEVLLQERATKATRRLPFVDAEYRSLLERISRSSFGVSFGQLRARRGSHAGHSRKRPRPRPQKKRHSKRW